MNAILSIQRHHIVDLEPFFSVEATEVTVALPEGTQRFAVLCGSTLAEIVPLCYFRTLDEAASVMDDLRTFMDARARGAAVKYVDASKLFFQPTPAAIAEVLRMISEGKL